jgi:hypothetical protein
MTTDDALWALLLDQAARERAPLLVVGPEPAASRLLGELLGELGRQHVIAIPGAPTATWPGASGGGALVIVPDPKAGLDLTGVVRACLRQDPDGFVVQAARADLPWQLLAQAALTGHQLVLHVLDADDEEAALAGLRVALAGDGLLPCQVLPWLVVLDDAGVARVVVTDGALGARAVVAWRRGDPVPADLYELWPAARPTRAAPIEEAPPQPLDPEAIERVRALVAPHLRTAFAPVCEPSPGDPARSKLGGLPMLASGEAWPRCACGAAMPLALQLARAEVPAAAQVCFPEGAGWLQLFYCCDGSCGVEDAWTAASPNKRLRFLSASGATAPRELPELRDVDWAPHDIVRWDEHTDTPSSEDLEGAPRDVLDDRHALADHARLEPDLAHLAGPRRGDKLLGWPAWEQAPDWQPCPRCGARMEPLFQLDAYQGALTMLFAADGTGHVTQCPTHLDALAFVWACG